MSVDFLALLEDEVKKFEAEIPDDSSLANISELANRQVALEDLLNRMSEATAKVSNQLRDISENRLPLALQAAGISEFKLADGSKITTKTEYYPSIQDEHKDATYEWMAMNGHDIVKNEVSCKFNKGSDAEAMEAYNKLEELGFEPTKKMSIHASTLKAWVKKSLEDGIQLPDTINVFTVNKAVIKRGK